MTDNNIVARLKMFMDHHSLNSLAMSKLLGYRSSEKLSRLFRDGGAKPSYDIIYDITSKFEINTDWLITGRGEMLAKPQGEDQAVEHEHEHEPEPGTGTETLDEQSNQPILESDDSILYNMYKEERAKVEAQAEQIGELKQTIRQLEERIEGLQTDASAESDSGSEDALDAGIADVG